MYYALNFCFVILAACNIFLDPTKVMIVPIVIMGILQLWHDLSISKFVSKHHPKDLNVTSAQKHHRQKVVLPIIRTFAKGELKLLKINY